MSSNPKRHVLVVGGSGFVGQAIVRALLARGHEVTVLDTDSFAFRRLLPEFTGRRLVGSGTDDRMLLEAGIHPLHARWTIRDAWDRAALRRAKATRWATFF